MSSNVSTHRLTRFVDLGQPRLGSRVVYATDEFFAEKIRLISPAEPVWIPDKYDDNGKWMDGWESRRKRTPGHDYCIVRLGVPGLIHGFDIDTRHFTGNYPPAASIDACVYDDDIPPDDMTWTEIVPRTDLVGDSRHFVDAKPGREFSHVRLNIYPDGGVARLRIYGSIRPDWHSMDLSQPVDLLAMKSGGRALACNDEHFGSMRNLNAPGRGINMGDGWETARRRVPGNDWVVMALGHPGHIEEIEIDTAHFKGNYPDRVMIRAGYMIEATDEEAVAASQQWPILLSEQKLKPDHQHIFKSLNGHDAVTHVLMNIYPDGGVSRLHIRGYPAGID
ncbi:MAG: allantoicase [Pseudomonadota bacterium]